MMIPAHGGRLVDRLAPESERDALRRRAASLPAIRLNRRESSDLALLAIGAMSPLQGFMLRDEYESVLDRMRLPSGLPWSLPVTVSIKSQELAAQPVPFVAALENPDGERVGVMTVEETWPVDREHEAQRALGTTDAAHPGVQYLETIGDTYAGGRVTLFDRPQQPPFDDHHLLPRETRALFAQKGWERVCAFQTRNPIHRAHEYLVKCALEIVDGFLIHPAMGETKPDDIPADVRMECYLALIENHFPPTNVTLSVFPYAMRYAGPREAILHALIRKNYGCTHFIVGRDHAGVGNYYGTYDAQAIFSEFEHGELGITPLFFEHSFYCRRCGAMASQKTCPHGKDDHVFLSGTKVRAMLAAGEPLPEEFTRREVAAILERHYVPGGNGNG